MPPGNLIASSGNKYLVPLKTTLRIDRYTYECWVSLKCIREEMIPVIDKDTKVYLRSYSSEGAM
jgi:hypothetical protein